MRFEFSVFGLGSHCFMNKISTAFDHTSYKKNVVLMLVDDCQRTYDTRDLHRNHQVTAKK